MRRRGGLRTGIIVFISLLILGAPVILGAVVVARVPACPFALVAYTGSGFPADRDGRSGVGWRLTIGLPTDGEPRQLRVEVWRPAPEGERARLSGRRDRSLAARVRSVVMAGRAVHDVASALLRCVRDRHGDSNDPGF